MQMFGECLWGLGTVHEKIVGRLEIIHSLNGILANTHIRTVTFVSLLPLMSSSVRDFSAFRDVPTSVTALSWRYRIVRLSIPSRSAGVT